MTLTLRIVLVASLLCRIDSLRLTRRYEQAHAHELKSNSSVASLTASHPASPDCFLSSGFGLQRGCQYAGAMQPVPTCETASFDEACYEESNTEHARGYLQDVRTSSDYSNLVKSVTDAEGGGFGVTVSASFSYLQRSEVGEKSTAFFIGASGRSKTRTIQRPMLMKLTAAAKGLLQTNPKAFLSRYGMRYVYKITYGGSFLGSFTLNSKQTSDTRDIQAFAEVSVHKGVFEASGKTDFQNAMEKSGSKISIFASADWKGGSGIMSDYSTPEAMGSMFRQWDETWRSSPEPLTVVTRRWIDSEEVQQIVDGLSREDQALFRHDDIQPIMQREISEENANVMRVEHSAKQALSWSITSSNSVLRSCLRDLSRELRRKRLEIDSLDDVDVVAIQSQFLNRDYSWFQSDELHERYVECVANIPEHYGAFPRAFGIMVWYPPGDATWMDVKKTGLRTSLDNCKAECSKYSKCWGVAYYSPTARCFLGDAQLGDLSPSSAKTWTTYRKQSR